MRAIASPPADGDHSSSRAPTDDREISSRLSSSRRLAGAVGRVSGVVLCGQRSQDLGDPGVELLECPRVDVREVGALHLLPVRNESVFALVLPATATSFAQLRRRSDDDDLVETCLGSDLVEERYLRHAHGGRFRKSGELLAPGHVLPRHERVQELLEEVERFSIPEDA